MALPTPTHKKWGHKERSLYDSKEDKEFLTIKNNARKMEEKTIVSRQ
jgi:hypothetical protein